MSKFVFDLCVVGAERAGKTALLQRGCQTADDHYKFAVSLGNFHVTLQLWELDGASVARGDALDVFKGAVLVFDATDEQSLLRTEEVRKAVSYVTARQHFFLTCVGNKVDSEVAVHEDRLTDYCETINAPGPFYCSALTGLAVTNFFEKTALDMLKFSHEKTADDTDFESKWKSLPPRRSACSYGTACKYFHSKKHTETYLHPFIPACPGTPFSCFNCDEEHLDKYSHICRFAQFCEDRNDPEHQKHFIHLYIERCPNWNNCKDLSEIHLGTYLHTDCFPFRKKCPLPWCANTSAAHRKRFQHSAPTLQSCPIVMLNTKNPNGDEYDAQKRKIPAERYVIDFEANAEKWMHNIEAYECGRIKTDDPKYLQVKNWFENIRPVHMCSANAFRSMCELGFIGSLTEFNRLWISPKRIVDLVRTRQNIKQLYESYPDYIPVFEKFIKLTIRNMQSGLKGQLDTVERKLNEDLKSFDKKANAYTENAEVEKGKIKDKIAAIHYIKRQTPVITVEKKELLDEMHDGMSSIFGEDVIRTIIDESDKIVKSLFTFVENPPGLGFNADLATKTNHTVFTIFGPHRYNYGGTEVILFMRPAITYHPDFYNTPTAALFYFNGKYRSQAQHAVPWMGETKKWEEGAEDDLISERMHPVVESWSEIFAKDFMLRAQISQKQKMNRIDLKDVLSHWHLVDPHTVIEGHLPPFVPMDYVEHIVVLDSKLPTLLESPIVADMIHRWEGMKMFDTKPDKKSIRESSFEYQNRPATCVPKGLSFVVTPGKMEQVMPLLIKRESTVATLDFMAKGTSLFVSFSNVCHFHTRDEGSRNVVSVYFGSVDAKAPADVFPDSVYIMNGPPISCESSILAQCLDFNEGCQKEDFIYYSIDINYINNTITVSHWGPSTLFNRKEISATIPFAHDAMAKFRFVSVAAGTGNPTIWNMTLKQEMAGGVAFQDKTVALPIPASQQQRMRASQAPATTARRPQHNVPAQSGHRAPPPRAPPTAPGPRPAAPPPTRAVPAPAVSPTVTPPAREEAPLETPKPAVAKPMPPPARAMPPPARAAPPATLTPVKAMPPAAKAVPPSFKATPPAVKATPPPQRASPPPQAAAAPQQVRGRPPITSRLSRAVPQQRVVVRAGPAIPAPVPTVAQTVAPTPASVIAQPSVTYERPTVPWCPEPFTCRIVRAGPRSPEYQQHCTQYAHVCLFGAECNGQHPPGIVHMYKPACQLGRSCPQMNDPQHRYDFHHAGLWDFLVRCKNGPACPTAAREPADRYFHQPTFDYPPASSFVYSRTSKLSQLL